MESANGPWDMERNKSRQQDQSGLLADDEDMLLDEKAAKASTMLV